MVEKPDRLIGVLTYKDSEYSYEFDKEKFRLHLYPRQTAKLSKNKEIKNFIIENFSKNKVNEWLVNMNVKGKTEDNIKVIFNILDYSINNNEFLIFEVNWYILYNTTKAKFKSFELAGEDMNLFYRPYKDIETIKNEKTDNDELYRIIIKKPVVDVLGEYTMQSGANIKLETFVKTSIKMNFFEEKVHAYSILGGKFYEEKGLNIILQMCEIIKNFFRYITYRKNIDLGDIRLYNENEDRALENVGIIVIKPTYNKEISQKKGITIIKYNILKNKVLKLLTHFEKNEIALNHIVESITDRYNYSENRVMMILTAFEKEFKNIYGQEYKRSEKYIKIKKEIIENMEIFKKEKTGVEKKYIDDIKKYINNKDISYKEKVKKALKDNENVMTDVIKKYYNENFDDIIDDIGEEIAKLRNCIAHNNLNGECGPELLNNIKIVENLLYVMRLKYIKLSDNQCKEAIRNLFFYQ